MPLNIIETVEFKFFVFFGCRSPKTGVSAYKFWYVVSVLFMQMGIQIHYVGKNNPMN